MKNYYLVAFICLIFFVLSIIMTIFSSINPDVIETFDLSLTTAAVLQFSLWIAYGVMSIPSGMLVERYGEKPVLVFAFSLTFLGALTFAMFPNYLVAIIMLLIIGIGIAMLQVPLHPLLRVAGGKEYFALSELMIQCAFGIGAFISPRVYSYLVTRLDGPTEEYNPLLSLLSQVVPSDMGWVSLFWIFAAMSFAMIVAVSLWRLPRVELTADERLGGWETTKCLLKNKTVILFTLAIFAYVGTEQGVASWISKFLATYHGCDPQLEGARVVSCYWGMFTAGTVLGFVLLMFFDSRRVLIAFCVAAMICLSLALFGSLRVAGVAFPLVGFFVSSMWCILFSLALNSMERHHGAFTGILLTGGIGGAVAPLIIGGLGDLFGLRFGLMFVYLLLAFVLSVGLWARPLVTNKIFRLFGGKDAARNPAPI